MTFTCSTNGFYIQQMTFTFNKNFAYSLKFVFSNMRFIFNNLRFAFNEIKFIKLKPFTFSKPNLDVTKYKIKKIWHNGRSGLLVVHPICKYFFSNFSNVLFTIQRWCLREKFSVSFYYPVGQWTYAKNWDWGRDLVTWMWTLHKFFVWI